MRIRAKCRLSHLPGRRDVDVLEGRWDRCVDFASCAGFLTPPAVGFRDALDGGCRRD
ncbi:MAG: hypothetical protein H0T78_07250 [Longispora sp.]|nr:hypothetical protein [Longispora sp. (in: high G+C Gram-positive bacteria)]